MSRKHHKPWHKMTTAELREATREFDEPMIVPRVSRPLNAADRALHRQARKRGRPRIGQGAAKLYISMERGLLKQADAYARKHGLSRSELIATGVRTLISSAA